MPSRIVPPICVLEPAHARTHARTHTHTSTHTQKISSAPRSHDVDSAAAPPTRPAPRPIRSSRGIAACKRRSAGSVAAPQRMRAVGCQAFRRHRPGPWRERACAQRRRRTFGHEDHHRVGGRLVELLAVGVAPPQQCPRRLNHRHLRRLRQPRATTTSMRARTILPHAIGSSRPAPSSGVRLLSASASASASLSQTHPPSAPRSMRRTCRPRQMPRNGLSVSRA